RRGDHGHRRSRRRDRGEARGHGVFCARGRRRDRLSPLPALGQPRMGEAPGFASGSRLGASKSPRPAGHGFVSPATTLSRFSIDAGGRISVTPRVRRTMAGDWPAATRYVDPGRGDLVMLRFGTFGQVLAAAAVVVLSAGAARADKCAGAKLKAVSKREAGLIKCQAKVAA